MERLNPESSDCKQGFTNPLLDAVQATGSSSCVLAISVKTRFHPPYAVFKPHRSPAR